MIIFVEKKNAKLENCLHFSLPKNIFFFHVILIFQFKKNIHSVQTIEKIQSTYFYKFTKIVNKKCLPSFLSM